MAVHLRRVVHCPHCGFTTAKVHDRRRVARKPLTYGGRLTTLMWLRRQFSCYECGEPFSVERHPEFVGNPVTCVTRGLARTLVRTSTAAPSGSVTPLPGGAIMEEPRRGAHPSPPRGNPNVAIGSPDASAVEDIALDRS